MTDFVVKSADGTSLKGSVLSNPQNPIAVVTLIHGFGEHFKRYQAMADYLAQLGIAVIAADLRGHGQSEGKRGTISSYNELGQDLNAIMHETRKRFASVPHILYGHSMGGGLVLNQVLSDDAVGHDLYGVISSAPLLRLKKPPNTILRGVVSFLCLFVPKLSLKSPIDGTKVSTIPSEQEAYVRDPLNHGQMSLALAKGMVEAGEEALTKVSAWQTPLLLLHSKNDQLTDFNASQDFAARAQYCEFHAFENVEHEMHNDTSRDAVFALMKDFILKQIKRAPA